MQVTDGQEQQAMTKSDKVLVILFRYLLGIGSLFALVPVLMPWSWMAATHRWLGLGEMPTGLGGGLAVGQSLLVEAEKSADLQVGNHPKPPCGKASGKLPSAADREI